MRVLGGDLRPAIHTRAAIHTRLGNRTRGAWLPAPADGSIVDIDGA